MSVNETGPDSPLKMSPSIGSWQSTEAPSPSSQESSSGRSTLDEPIADWMGLGPHRFLEVAPHAVLLVDRTGVIRFANHMAMQTLGYARGEMIGRPVHFLVPDDRRPKHADLFAGWFKHPRTRPMGEDLGIEGRNKNGDLMKLDIQLSPIETDTGVWAIAWIEERKT